MIADVKVRKWGNSLGLIIPKELVEEQHLRPNQKVTISVMRPVDFSEIFGTLKETIPGQQAKNLARKGWE